MPYVYTCHSFLCVLPPWLGSKESACNAGGIEDTGWIPALGHALQVMTTHSSILAWRIPWTEEPGGLQSIESQIVGYD